MGRAQLIADALAARLDQLRQEADARMAGSVLPQDEDFVSQIVAHLRTHPLPCPLDAWSLEQSAGTSSAGLDGLAVIRELALGHEIPLLEQEPAIPVEHAAFAKMAPPDRFAALSVAGFPQALVKPSYEWLREELLRQLMVGDRSRLDEGRLHELHHDYLLLKLNFTAVMAGGSGDLRYLDAINFWYERIPAGWKPSGQHAWLWPSLLSIYAQILTAAALRWRQCA